MTNKVLIIGGGPSYWTKLDLARKFTGKIIAVEVVAPTIIEEGIIPDYICTFEKREGIELTWFPEEYRGQKFEVITNFDSLKKLSLHLNKLGLKNREFKSYRWERINNVGLFACRFAREILDAKEIYLIGFDHSGVDIYGMEYDSYVIKGWMECFKHFLDDERNNCKIINCSGQGKLFLPGIQDGRNLKEI